MKNQKVIKRAKLSITFFLIVLPFMLFTSCSSITKLSSEKDEVIFAKNLVSSGFQFRITESYWTNDYLGKKPEYKYLVVKIAIKNLGNDLLKLGGGLELYYRACGEGKDEFGPISVEGVDLSYQGINPKMTKTGILVFDIPFAQYNFKLNLVDEYANVSGIDKLLLGASNVKESYLFPLEPKNN